MASGSEIEVLLISSEDSDYWAIPNGDIRRHELQYRCAQRQALEKAGVTGRIAKSPTGQYAHRTSLRWSRLTVQVHLLFVETEIEDFRPPGGRRCVWLSARNAHELAREPELRQLLGSIESDSAPKFVANIRKTLSAPGTILKPREMQSHGGSPRA